MTENIGKETNRISWESDLPIWQSYAGNKPCHLCGEPDAPVYKKGHSRKNGVMLEASQLYCRNCDTNRKEEVQQDFDKWWSEEWTKCEAECEANWQKYGIYGNCWDSMKNQPSTHFGYVKNEDGTFTPYIYLELPSHIPWNDMKAQMIGNKLDELMGNQKPLKKCLMYKYKLYGANSNQGKMLDRKIAMEVTLLHALEIKYSEGF